MAGLMGHHRLGFRGTSETALTGLVEETGVVIKDITPAVALLVVQFADDFPRDPIDRIIAATSRAEGLPLVTRDAKLRRRRLVETVWGYHLPDEWAAPREALPLQPRRWREAPPERP